MTRRLAVVLMNLGAPDSLAAVRPFLKNLFSDPAIINLPGPFRTLAAKIISRARTQKAQKIYQKMGGGSPLLQNTKDQQIHLRHLLRNQLPDHEVEVFIAMRYWHPLTAETVAQVASFQATEIVLLPLYPQFSMTTTGSSFLEWYKQAAQWGLKIPTREVQSYPQDNAFIEAHVDLLLPWIEKAAVFGTPRILFSAHGLPQKVIDKGDPYENHVHKTVQAILKKIPSGLESVVCYQSKVGPLKWLKPSIEQELKRAGADRVSVIVEPVAFVSEHSETLVELDEDYRGLAETLGIPFYGRVPTLSVHPAYMQALAGLVVRGDIKTVEVVEMDDWFLWVKAVHVFAIIAWMVGLLYLPRLFVYHVGVDPDSEAAQLFKVMEYRLSKIIMVPSLFLSLASGIFLAMTQEAWSSGWFHLKLTCVFSLLIFHHLLSRWRKQLALGTCIRNASFFRMINEVPSLLLIVIIISVIVKPF